VQPVAVALHPYLKFLGSVSYYPMSIGTLRTRNEEEKKKKKEERKEKKKKKKKKKSDERKENTNRSIVLRDVNDSFLVSCGT